MSFQKVVGHIGLRAQRQSGYEGPVPQFLTREALVLQGIVEIRRGAGVLACIRAEGDADGVIAIREPMPGRQKRKKNAATEPSRYGDWRAINLIRIQLSF